MNNNRLVSVLMPVFNCEHMVRAAIDSILHQSYQYFELLICDDGSTDDTWAMVSRLTDNRIRLFRNPTNLGIVKTRNQLMAQARGEYFITQDADDWSDIRRIEILLNTFDGHQGLDACITSSFKVSRELISDGPGDGRSFMVTLKDCLSLSFAPATLMIRRSVYDGLGGYHPFFSRFFAEDIYWVIRIVEKYKVMYLDIPLYFYCFNPNSVTNSVKGKRSLIMIDLIREIIDQRIKSGTDWIEEDNMGAIERFEVERFGNNDWLSEKYRQLAAVQRDGRKRLTALRLISRALLLSPTHWRNYVTLKYILSF